MDKRHLSPDDQDENYFVSMTDLMIGMLFIFIIVLMAFALNLRETQQTQELINEELTGARKAREQMLEALRRSLEARGVKVEIDPESGVLRLKADLLFERGESGLTTTGEEIIGHVGDALQQVLPCYANLPGISRPTHCPAFRGGRLEALFIEGHTDADDFAPGSIKNNWMLSTERAINTFRTIIEHHAVLDDLRNDAGQNLIGVSGYEKRRPTTRYTGQTEAEKKRADRRIDLRFIMTSPKPPPQTDVEQTLNEDSLQ